MMSAPSCLADADDTANVLAALSILGRDVNIEPMLAAFEKDEHFITYQGERNASFSANCNVLLCLLRSPKRRMYTSQVAKSVKFLESLWKQGKTQDKWVSKAFERLGHPLTRSRTRHRTTR